MAICIFEDNKVRTLFPLVHCQPVFDLRCGIFTVSERAQRYFPNEKFTFIVRDYLKEVVKERHPNCEVNQIPYEATIFINARYLFDSASIEVIKSCDKKNAILFIGDTIAAITSSKADAIFVSEILTSHESTSSLKGFEIVQIEGILISYPWNLIKENHSMLLNDAKIFFSSTITHKHEKYHHVSFVQPENICIGEGCTIQPGVVLTAEDGPIIIDDHATIMANAVIIGPAYIGQRSIVKIGAKMYGNTSIGSACKVGGEIEGSIIHSYANKQHDGFLGHSYLSPWTNLGAGTNTSDLKNTYGSIRMTLEGTQYDTGEMFLGLIMADHAKCGINTMFNTGTSVGVGSNVFGSDYPPKFIPSFSWGGASGLKEYDFEKFIVVARTVMARRGCECTTAEELLVKHVFQATSEQRRLF